MIKLKEDSVVCADFLSVSRTLSNNSFDLVIMDFPYGVDWSTNHRIHSSVLGQHGIENDSPEAHFLLNKKGLPEIYRLLKNDRHVYYFTRWDMLEFDIPALREAGFNVKNTIVWVKNNWGMGDLEGAYAPQHEFIIFAQKGRRHLLRGRMRDVQRFDRIAGDRLLHSHQKPLSLLSWLIKNSTHRGEKVFDPTAGVGSTVVSAIVTERIGYGIEIDPETTAMAKEYIEVLGNPRAAHHNASSAVRQELLF